STEASSSATCTWTLSVARCTVPPPPPLPVVSLGVPSGGLASPPHAAAARASASARVRAAPCVSVRIRASSCTTIVRRSARPAPASAPGGALRDAEAALVLPAEARMRALAVEVVAELLAVQRAGTGAHHGRVGRQGAASRAGRAHRGHRAEAEHAQDAERVCHAEQDREYAHGSLHGPKGELSQERATG